jgi:MinD superfamily P-loop ATPase
MGENRKSVKQLVILSGKGGTGKTCISAGLIDISSRFMDGVYVDADVDAANLALVTGSNIIERHPFTGSKLAIIDSDLCTRCGNCYDVCRYNAIQQPTPEDDRYQVIELLCDGCASCVYACPEMAIRMETQQEGEWFHSETEYGHLFHAELFPAAENTGKLVTNVKQNAKLFAEDHNIPLMIVDGPPGIGCPVISASAGADLALLVAEPSVSGIHDLERIIKTLEHFNVHALICINKSDIYPKGTQEIIDLANAYQHPVVGRIHFDPDIPVAMVNAQPITKFKPENSSSKEMTHIWHEIQTRLFKER